MEEKNEFKSGCGYTVIFSDWISPGFQLRGVVRGFDTFVILFDCDGKQEMIYKHAISTVIPQRKLEMNGRREAVTA